MAFTERGYVPQSGTSPSIPASPTFFRITTRCGWCYAHSRAPIFFVCCVYFVVYQKSSFRYSLLRAVSENHHHWRRVAGRLHRAGREARKLAALHGRVLSLIHI